MRPLSSLILTALALAHSVSSADVAQKRQVVIPEHGTTVQPSDGSTIAPGSTFPFEYEQSNFFHGGYSPISVYIGDVPPSADNVTTSGGLADGSYLYHFGDWLIPNFGLPPMENPPPPPSTLTMPDLNEAEGTILYFSVVETIDNVPPTGSTDYALETTTVIYG